MNHVQRYLVLASALVTGLSATLIATGAAAERFKIGFSQATSTEPWRVLFNKELRDEAARHPEVELLFRDAHDSAERQVADVRSLLAAGVQAILISPKDPQALTPVCAEAYSRGVPVFVLDRDLEGDKYTQFIGGDNMEIGRAAGRFVVEMLGGTGKAKGTVVELWGGKDAHLSRHRHAGFREIIAKEIGVKVVYEKDADGKQARAYDAMAEAMEAIPGRIDVVFAHNDPMAYGAYQAAKDVGMEQRIRFIGIDGIPQEGVTWVHDGLLAATFLYTPPGAEGIRQALKVLKGEQVPRRIILPTRTIDSPASVGVLRAHGLLN